MPRSATAATAPAVSPDTTGIFVSLGTVVQRLRKLPVDESLVDALKGLKPRPRQVAALFQLAGDDALSVSELAARMQISLATASQLVGELADLGLVRRVEDPNDRRRTLVEISRDHRRLVAAVQETRLRPLEAALARLSPDERAALCHGLQRLAAELESGDAGRTREQLEGISR